MVELEGCDGIEANKEQERGARGDRVDSLEEVAGAAESERDDWRGSCGQRPTSVRRPFIVAYGLSRSTLESLAFRSNATGLLDAMAARRGGPWQREATTGASAPIRLAPRLPNPARGVINRPGGVKKATSIQRASKALPRFTGRHVPAVRFNEIAAAGEDGDDDVSILSDDDSLARSRGVGRKRS